MNRALYRHDRYYGQRAPFTGCITTTANKVDLTPLFESLLNVELTNER